MKIILPVCISLFFLKKKTIKLISITNLNRPYIEVLFKKEWLTNIYSKVFFEAVKNQTYRRWFCTKNINFKIQIKIYFLFKINKEERWDVRAVCGFERCRVLIPWYIKKNKTTNYFQVDDQFQIISNIYFPVLQESSN